MSGSEVACLFCHLVSLTLFEGIDVEYGIFGINSLGEGKEDIKRERHKLDEELTDCRLSSQGSL